jgi:HSP20 family protein
MAESAKESKVSVDLDKTPASSKSKEGAVTRFDEFEQDVERLFDNFMSRNWLRPFRDFPNLRSNIELPRAPRVDLVERDDEVVVRAQLPGMDKKDIEVSVTDRMITIRASTRKEDKEEKGEYYRREISTGEVSRTLTLPAEVDGTKAQAEFKDGILEIVIPKVAKSKRVQVDVK